MEMKQIAASRSGYTIVFANPKGGYVTAEILRRETIFTPTLQPPAGLTLGAGCRTLIEDPVAEGGYRIIDPQKERARKLLSEMRAELQKSRGTSPFITK